MKRARGILPAKADLQASHSGDCLGVAADPAALAALELAELRRQLREARQAARVLAHAWDHDAEPPTWALELSRRWDAHGEPEPPGPFGGLLRRALRG